MGFLEGLLLELKVLNFSEVSIVYCFSPLLYCSYRIAIGQLVWLLHGILKGLYRSKRSVSKTLIGA